MNCLDNTKWHNATVLGYCNVTVKIVQNSFFAVGHVVLYPELRFKSQLTN